VIVLKIFISGLYPVSKHSAPLLKSLIVFYFSIQISIWQIFEKILFKNFFLKMTEAYFKALSLVNFLTKNFKKLTNA